jgi:hypothetical protein
MSLNNLIASAQNEGNDLIESANSLLISANNGGLTTEQLNELIASISENIEYRQQLIQQAQQEAQQEYDITDEQAQEYSAELSYITAVENKIKLDKAQLLALENLANKKQREYGITRYYKQYYNAWQKVSYETFLYVIANCILLLIAFFLKKGFTVPYVKYKIGGPDSEIGNIFAIIPALFLAYTVYHIYYLTRDYYRRDQNVFDEYDYPNTLATVTNNSEEPEPEADVNADCIISDPTDMTQSQYSIITGAGCSIECTDGAFSTTTYACEPEPEPANDGFIGYMNTSMEGYMHQPEPAIEGFIGYTYEPEPEPEIDTSIACNGTCGTCSIEAFDNFSNNYNPILFG